MVFIGVFIIFKSNKGCDAVFIDQHTIYTVVFQPLFLDRGIRLFE